MSEGLVARVTSTSDFCHRCGICGESFREEEEVCFRVRFEPVGWLHKSCVLHEAAVKSKGAVG